MLLEFFKWKLFYAANRLADYVSPPETLHANIVEPISNEAVSGPTIWVFCSTIGEFNACRPLIDRMAREGFLVFLTDRDCYSDSFQRIYPSAAVIELSGRITDAEYLISNYKPDLMVVCEIPALPNDAPCRLSYAILRAAMKAGARINLVNAWLYNYDAACRMDTIERRLFSRDYLSLFDFVSVQSKEVRDTLVAKGLSEERVAISGNMKFDALKCAGQLPQSTHERVLELLRPGWSKVIVAGCLAGVSECQSLFPALREIKSNDANAFFVLAPRHPENKDFMSSFLQLLAANSLSYSLKSLHDAGEPVSSDVLVLDTFGELMQFYAIADVCYVGCNHNILEPLSYGKRTVISGVWNTMYPSYPVYAVSRSRGLVYESDEGTELAHLFQSLLDSDARDDRERILQELDELSGAVEISYQSLGLEC